MVRYRSLVSVVCVAALFTSVSAKKNPYMIPGTDEYNNVTAKLIGSYDISSYTKKDEGEQIGKTYVSGTMEIKEQEKKGRPGVVVFSFVVAPDVTKGRIETWGKKKKDLEVEEYKIVTTLEWNLSKSGDILYLEDGVSTAEIKGSGKKLKNFQGFEKSVLESASEMKNDGGLNGMMGSMIMSKSTGTDKFIPEIPSQTNFEMTDDGMTFKNISKLGFEFKK